MAIIVTVFEHVPTRVVAEKLFYDSALQSSKCFPRRDVFINEFEPIRKVSRFG